MWSSLGFVWLALQSGSVLAGIMLSPGRRSPPAQPLQTTTTEEPLSPAQIALNNQCLGKCITELCYLSDDTDCRKFIMCERDAQSRYKASLQPCAFGTYWGGYDQQRRITCDRPYNVNCNIDYCAGRVSGEKFKHPDGNCKTYWECTGNVPMPFCCPDGYYFDSTLNMCQTDETFTCHDACPLRADAAACMQLGQASAFLDDGNCRTYWDCEQQNPHPVCCTAGKSYDIRTGTCITNMNCRDECPQQYQTDVCRTGTGRQTYDITDTHCRTYMKCSNNSYDERWCCPSQHFFDPLTQNCQPINYGEKMKCDDVCPLGYREFCPLTKSASNPSSFIQSDINGVEWEMKCAPGTTFDESACACGVFVKNAPDNSCNMELDILFDAPIMERRGSQRTVQIKKMSGGEMLDAPALNKRKPFVFDGNLTLRTPFGQQQFDNVYISIIFRPENNAVGGPQVLLSNCMNQALGAATLELILEKGDVVFRVVTDHRVTKAGIAGVVDIPATLRIPFVVGMWQVVTAIYDGTTLHLALEGQGRPTYASMPLTGNIPVAAEGLLFGGCVVQGGEQRRGEGFIGSMAKLQFSKCLQQQWLDNFFMVLGVEPPTPPPTSTPAAAP
ncbi:uncharacterized protein LOC128238781 [Mya arenaria]|uniref:uncharacterized protein LOC128238781 n=1 Tax=Mya arenaria TaxID=6604 RepID=UPI0022E8B4E3|nr:uncharacterized protein LOC128238781 [Mya arenaria]XP_052810994.1 uncharacterized protein LOC128238781 [Mya arenaria]